jgi:hypothetical protein
MKVTRIESGQVTVVVTLTWIVMPLLVKLFNPLLKQRTVGR